MLTINGYQGLPRNLDDFRNPGLRFHGFVGEPRDAFVYLILGFGVLSIKDIWINKINLTYLKILLIIFALLLTKSASGIFGLIFSSILLFIYFIPIIQCNKILPLLIIIFFLCIISYFSITYTQRLLLYFSFFSELYPTLKAGDIVQGPLSVVMNNIYPIWHRFKEILNLNLTPLILGTGLGSTSIINNFYYGSSGREFNIIINPNSNLIRIIYETGILGILIYISAFIQPIKRNFIPKEIFFKMIFCMFIILGSSFAHRTITPFLFLGLLLKILEIKYLPSYFFKTNSIS